MLLSRSKKVLSVKNIYETQKNYDMVVRYLYTGGCFKSRLASIRIWPRLGDEIVNQEPIRTSVKRKWQYVAHLTPGSKTTTFLHLCISGFLPHEGEVHTYIHKT